MGRIHRYGQDKDCLIFNFVSTNTREGRVLQKLFERIQAIEGQLNEIKALLHQAHHNSLAQDSGYGASRPPRTKRPPSEGEQK